MASPSQIAPGASDTAPGIPAADCVPVSQPSIDAETFIEVDCEQTNSNGDYLSSGLESATTPLSSAIHDYLEENGRRYHVYYGRDKNLLPNDETESDRMDVHYQALRLLMDGKLHRATLPEPLNRVLDLGTGTGIWAMDFADQHPESEVIGTDLSPIQPKWVPPNCRFELDDAELSWTYPPATFDFIHARNLYQSIADWPGLLRSIFEALRPGGVVEVADVDTSRLQADDGTLPEDDVINTYFRELTDAMIAIGRPPPRPEVLKKMMEEAGFVDVNTHSAKQPLNTWPKDRRLKQVGAIMFGVTQTGFHAYGMAVFTRHAGMQEEKANKLCRDTFRSILDRKKHIYNFVYTVWAKKPNEEPVRPL